MIGNQKINFKLLDKQNSKIMPSSTTSRDDCLTSEERRAELAKASREYLAGTIDQAAFRRIEQKYMTDYDSAFYELSRFSPWIRQQMHRISDSSRRFRSYLTKDR